MLFYFHLRDGHEIVLDPEGRDLDDQAAIAAAALRDARSIIRDDVRHGRIRLDQRIDVEDGASVVVHSLAFSDSVEIIYP